MLATTQEETGHQSAAQSLLIVIRDSATSLVDEMGRKSQSYELGAANDAVLLPPEDQIIAISRSPIQMDAIAYVYHFILFWCM
jgi:hypothetical protein